MRQRAVDEICEFRSCKIDNFCTSAFGISSCTDFAIASATNRCYGMAVADERNATDANRS
jgi:hypothetical protein